MYQVLARSGGLQFDELVGQGHVARTLGNSVAMIGSPTRPSRASGDREDDRRADLRESA
jgi:hypothetical protein